MVRVAKRRSLVTQAVEILREQIGRGAYGDLLPSEKSLAASLQVGRNTVRRALDRLCRDGWIEKGHPGRNRRILKQPTVTSATGSGDVGLLVPEELDELSYPVLYLIATYRGGLAQLGRNLKVHTSATFGHARPETRLARLVKTEPVACWLLIHATRAVQEWFQSSRIPCVVSGSLHEGVRLPSVDIDYRAMARHAAGLLIAKGHRRICLLRTGLGLAGHAAETIGCEEAFKSARLDPRDLIDLPHGGTVKAVCAAVDRILKIKGAPTGLLVSGPRYTLTAMSHLMRKGIRIPEDMSFICLDDDVDLEYVTPALTRYHSDLSLLARKVIARVRSFTEGGTPSLRVGKIMPDLIAGATVAPPPRP